MKTSLLNKILAITLTGFSTLSIAAHAEDLLDTVKTRGTLQIALEGTYPPFDSKDTQGKLVGFDVDVAKAVAAKLGVKPVFITTEWSGIIAGLKAGKFDMVVNQVGITPQRKESFDFSPPYTYSTAQLIQRKSDDRTFKSLGDLKGRKLGVVLGSNYNDMAKAVPGIIVITYPGASEELSDVASGRIDAALNDRLTLAYLLKTVALPLRPGASFGDSTEMGIPFRKGNPKFAKALADAIVSLKQDGSLTHISQKWFGIDVSKPVVR